MVNKPPRAEPDEQRCPLIMVFSQSTSRWTSAAGGHRLQDLVHPLQHGGRPLQGAAGARHLVHQDEPVGGAGHRRDQRPVLVCEFDVPANRVVLDVQAHDDDVNSVAYLDDSENVVLSGSDDAAIKLWDKRLLGTSGSPGEGEAKPAGVFYVSRSPSEGLWACVGDTD